MTKDRRQTEFADQLRDCPSVDAVHKDPENPNVLRVYVDGATYFVYMDYHRDFLWWGIAEQKRERLRSYDIPLLHAFLGSQRHQYYLIPDEKFHARPFSFGFQTKEGNTYRQVQANHGSNRALLERYTDLCALFRTGESCH